ncbi:hypothetical protein YC2023_071999 [Brassica napus]
MCALSVNLDEVRPWIRHLEGMVSLCMMSWSCHQTCGARGAATHASGAMPSHTRAATRLVSDWFWPTEGQSNEDQLRWESSQRGQREREREAKWSTWSVVDSHREGQLRPIDDSLRLLCGSSAQVNLSTLLIFFDDQVEVLFRKNCSEAKAGAVRVEFSPDQYQGRFCTSQDQSSPVQSRRPLGFGQVLSDQPAASRLEHCSDIKVVDIKAMRFPLLEARSWQEAKSNLVTAGTGLELYQCRGLGVKFVTLTGLSLARHVALPDHGVGLDGQSCSCLIVGWPVGLSSPTLGVGHPSVMFLFDCWPVGRPMLRTVRGCYIHVAS